MYELKYAIIKSTCDVEKNSQEALPQHPFIELYNFYM